MIYNEKSQCLVDLYGSYEDAETGLKLNGTRTLGENISDHSGTKAAYKAYGMIFLCLQLTLKLISQNYHEIYFYKANMGFNAFVFNAYINWISLTDFFPYSALFLKVFA